MSAQHSMKMSSMSASDAPSSVALTGLEKLLLVVPLLGGLFFGLVPLLAPKFLAQISAAPGNDPYIYRLAGAATLGYAIVLTMAIMGGRWLPARIVVIATLAFNLGSLYAIALTVAGGGAAWIVYAILVASIAITAITAWMLYRHRPAPAVTPDVAPWLAWLVRLLMVVATLVGASVLFAPVLFAQIFGLAGTDLFLYRQAGAATLGYGVMGFFQLRSRSWQQWRLPSAMSLVFNGVSFLVSLLAVVNGEALPLAYIITAASLAATVGSFLALLRQGN
ncbi:MAG: hypothetical protein K1X65_04875 [Caldilineales bacterium]|nr:hypothetical protein [Caldilineales bacterium]